MLHHLQSIEGDDLVNTVGLLLCSSLAYSHKTSLSAIAPTAANLPHRCLHQISLFVIHL